jgi:hypothetical protein
LGRTHGKYDCFVAFSKTPRAILTAVAHPRNGTIEAWAEATHNGRVRNRVPIPSAALFDRVQKPEFTEEKANPLTTRDHNWLTIGRFLFKIFSLF